MVLNLPLGQILYWSSNWASSMALNAALNTASKADSDLSVEQALDLTVVIPTFNGCDRLPQVIEHLRQQQDITGIRWEILIVDNNSTDTTQVTAAALQAGWTQAGWGPSQVPLRYCFEPRQGLAFARQCAIEAAQGRWVGFLDDDNWPDPDWVAQVHRFAQAHPEVAAFGSCIRAHYDSLPPSELRVLEPFLAIRDHGETLYPFEPETLRLPPGAGLVVDRQRWLASVPADLGLTGRVGDRQVSGEDSAALLYLHRGGGSKRLAKPIAYNPAQKIRHCLPARRFEAEALLQLAYGIGLATCKLRWIQAPHPLAQLALAIQTGLGGAKRFWQQLARAQAEDSERVTRFHLMFHLGSALSPLYALSPRLAMPRSIAQALMDGLLNLRRQGWVRSGRRLASPSSAGSLGLGTD